MKSKLIGYTDTAIMKIVISHVRRINPRLKIGQQFASAIESVRDGLVIKDDPIQQLKQIPENSIIVDSLPESIQLPPSPKAPKMVFTQTLKIMLSDLEKDASEIMGLYFKDGIYFHPYRVMMPHRDWLETYDVGADVMVACSDGNFQMKSNYVPIEVTQELIDSHSYVLVSFAVTD